MKLVDARSGKVIELGPGIMPSLFPDGLAPVFKYPDGESVVVLKVEPGLFTGRVYARTTSRDHKTNRLVTSEQWVPCGVRYMHPGFPLQRVMFFPS